jgi:hypothetical protein
MNCKKTFLFLFLHLFGFQNFFLLLLTTRPNKLERLSLQRFDVYEAKSVPKNGAPAMCSMWVGSHLTHKHQTRLERVTQYKHSSLFGLVVRDEGKFYNTELLPSWVSSRLTRKYQTRLQRVTRYKHSRLFGLIVRNHNTDVFPSWVGSWLCLKY